MDIDLISRALNFAAERHGDQRRKYSALLYTTHLVAVVQILRDYEIDDATIIAAAYLHDTVEDTDTTVMEIVREFGEQVGELVYWLTDAKDGNRASRTLQSCWRLSRAPFNAKLIKCADIIDNGTGLPERDPKFAPVFFEEKQRALRMMAAVEGEDLISLPIYKKAFEIANR